MTHRENGALERFRRRVLWSIGIVIFLALAAPISLGIYYQSASDRSALVVTCSSAKSNISQLEALAALERRLGIPQDFVIPELPEECR